MLELAGSEGVRKRDDPLAERGTVRLLSCSPGNWLLFGDLLARFPYNKNRAGNISLEGEQEEAVRRLERRLGSALSKVSARFHLLM
jgi:hypothetical protein